MLWTHLIGLTLPELSCLFGFYLAVWALLVLKDNPNVVVIMGPVALAGLVHGYAYGEAILAQR